MKIMGNNNNRYLYTSDVCVRPFSRRSDTHGHHLAVNPLPFSCVSFYCYLSSAKPFIFMILRSASFSRLSCLGILSVPPQQNFCLPIIKSGVAYYLLLVHRHEERRKISEICWKKIIKRNDANGIRPQVLFWCVKFNRISCPASLYVLIVAAMYIYRG